MPALDSCHSQIVRALEKAGWRVAPKPVEISSPINLLYADIEAFRTTEDDEQEIIILEAKCFTNPGSTMHDLYVAVGQYLVYQDLMQRTNIDNPLYLAIPIEVYYGIFEPIARAIADRNGMKLVLVNLEQEVIEKWLE